MCLMQKKLQLRLEFDVTMAARAAVIVVLSLAANVHAEVKSAAHGTTGSNFVEQLPPDLPLAASPYSILKIRLP